MRINKSRLVQHLDSLAAIGALPGGGVRRLAFSEADKQGRDYVEHVMRDLGLEVKIDAIGTILGIRKGRDERVVLTGSHTDTVGTGGRFDGSLGVVAGLEVIHTLNEAGIETQHAIGVISFVNEEGVRFMPDMMGSLYLTGALDLQTLRSTEGTDGKTIGECLDAHGFAGPDSLQMDVKGFIELHIEQGPVLESNRKTIGIVNRVQGLSWQEVTFTGETNHAGVTPMERRRDAGYAAAAVAAEVRNLTQRIAGLRATVGSVTLSPNLINVIAEEAKITVDLRHADDEQLVLAEQALSRVIDHIAGNEQVAVQQRSLARVHPVAFDEACITSVANAAEALGYPAMPLISGAGHDAQILASHMPAAMIFVPSQGGVSHNINEFTTSEHVEAGANVLLHAVLAQAHPLTK